jgi:hypothetical protein
VRHEDQLTAEFDVWLKNVWLKKGARTMKRRKTDSAGKKRITGPSVGGRNGRRALNALRHGIFLREPVIPGVESVREFRRFQSKALEAMAPQNEFQRDLAKRMVGLAWRLRRVELYEAAVIARGQEAAEVEAAEVLERAGHAAPSRLLEWSLSVMRASLKLIRRLPDLPTDRRVPSSQALEVLGVVADFTGVKFEDVIDLSVKVEDLESLPRHPLFRHWTPAEILEGIAQIAGRTDEQPEGLRLEAVQRLRKLSELGESEARRAFAVRDLHRRLRLLPDAAALDTVVRYEAHLSRQLTGALHEYEALQARGHGERVPLARLDVQGLD